MSSHYLVKCSTPKLYHFLESGVSWHRSLTVWLHFTGEVVNLNILVWNSLGILYIKNYENQFILTKLFNE